MNMINRREFLNGLLIAAPAIVTAKWMMPLGKIIMPSAQGILPYGVGSEMTATEVKMRGDMFYESDSYKSMVRSLEAVSDEMIQSILDVTTKQALRL